MNKIIISNLLIFLDKNMLLEFYKKTLKISAHFRLSEDIRELILFISDFLQIFKEFMWTVVQLSSLVKLSSL